MYSQTRKTRVCDTRISFFLPSLAGGGAERVIVLLGAELARRGADVSFLLGRAEGQFMDSLDNSIHVMDLKCGNMMSALPKVRRHLRDDKPDVFLSAISICNLIAGMAKKTVFGCPTHMVASLHSLESIALRLEGRMKSLIMRTLYPRTMRSIDTVIAVSRGVAEDFLTICPNCHDRTRVVWNPVVTDQLMALKEEEITERWFPRSDDSLSILAVGRLTPAKDFATLIDAFVEVKNHRDATLTILGDGELRGKLDRHIKDAGLQGSVQMPGFVSNPYKFMRGADVVVSSSTRESFGNVLIESLACGTPVVATDCPVGPGEILDGGTWGELVPVADTKALGQAILRAVDRFQDPEALKAYANTYSLTNICSSYIDAMKLTE